MIPEYTPYIIHTLFFGINFYILWIDFTKRKIPNILLILLFLLLPFWIYINNPNYPYFLYQCIFFIFFITLGILNHKKNVFLWSGDIKYFSILILFLWEKSITLFIGNIGVTTFIMLGIVSSILLWELYALEKNIFKNNKISSFPIKKIYQSITIFLFDWIFIGIFITFLTKILSGELFKITLISWELYLLISIVIFLLRSRLNYLTMHWEHRMIPIFGIIIFFWYFFQKYGQEGLLIEIYHYIKNIWPYALTFTITQWVTHWIFSHHKRVTKTIWIKNTFETIPYSIVIFFSYTLLYFFNIHLILF